MSNVSQSLGPRARNQEGMNVRTLQDGRIVVDFWKPQDILEKLIPLAEEEGILCIMKASGFVSYVELLDREGAPVPVHGYFKINSIEGNIVYPKKNGKNVLSWANVILEEEGGHELAGPVKSLIAKSHFQVILSTIDEPVSLDYLKELEKLYRKTLKDLNQW